MGHHRPLDITSAKAMPFASYYMPDAVLTAESDSDHQQADEFKLYMEAFSDPSPSSRLEV